MKGITATVAGLLLAACVHRGMSPQRECTGTPTATVYNSWHLPVDVYAEVDGRSEWLLGEVVPSDRREFTLPAGTTRLQYRWRRIQSGSGPGPGHIQVSYACR
jgi:hypothetical protein